MSIEQFSTCELADACQRLNIHCHMPSLFMQSPAQQTEQGTTFKVYGPAHTVQTIPNKGALLPKLATHHVDSAPAQSIVCISTPAGTTSANWGGLMGARAKFLQVKAAVIDGRCRDIEELRGQKFPVFSKTTSVHGAAKSTQTVAYGVPITMDGVLVRPNDMIVADANGVICIPKEKLEQVLELATKLTQQDQKCMDAIQNGTPIKEAFAKYRQKL